jgi:sugar phosphate isomerase/epimerase
VLKDNCRNSAVEPVTGVSTEVVNEVIEKRRGSVRIGIACWSLGQRIQLGIVKSATDFLAFAEELGYEGVALDEVFLPDVSDRKGNDGLRRELEQRGMYLDVGSKQLYELTQEVNAGRGAVIFERAKSLGSSVLKTTFQDVGERVNQGWSAADATSQIARTVDCLGTLEELARKYDLPVACENHIDFVNDEIVEILRQVDSPYVGLMLDTGNPLGLMEDSKALAQRVVKRVLGVHLKDGYVIPAKSGGADIVWCVAGEGLVDVGSILGGLEPGPRVNLNVELIVNQRWPLPIHDEAFWKTLPFGRSKRVELLGKVTEQLKMALPAPPVDAQELLEFERSQLLRDRVAVRAMCDRVGTAGPAGPVGKRTPTPS